MIKTINGKQYAYEQTSYRVGKKVKTKSKYLGPVASFFTPIPVEERGLKYIGKLMEKYPSPPSAAEQVIETVKERFTTDTDLKMPETPTAPSPAEKGSHQTGQTPESAPSAEADK